MRYSDHRSMDGSDNGDGGVGLVVNMVGMVCMGRACDGAGGIGFLRRVIC